MKLKTMFDKIYFDGMKPNHSMYLLINEDIKKKTNEKVIFFDDKKENLIIAKYYNWITVYITSDSNKDTNHSNYKFESISKAIKLFKQ